MDKVGDTGRESDGETDGEKRIERKTECVEKSNGECVCVCVRERERESGTDREREGGEREGRREREIYLNSASNQLYKLAFHYRAEYY